MVQRSMSSPSPTCVLCNRFATAAVCDISFNCTCATRLDGLPTRLTMWAPPIVAKTMRTWTSVQLSGKPRTNTQGGGVSSFEPPDVWSCRLRPPILLPLLLLLLEVELEEAEAADSNVCGGTAGVNANGRLLGAPEEKTWARRSVMSFACAEPMPASLLPSPPPPPAPLPLPATSLLLLLRLARPSRGPNA